MGEGGKETGCVINCKNEVWVVAGGGRGVENDSKQKTTEKKIGQ